MFDTLRTALYEWNTDSEMTFASILTKARIAKKLERDELAKLVGIETDSYARYELGRTRPSLPTLYKLCRLLDLSYEDLSPAFKPSKDTSDPHKKLGSILKKARTDMGLSLQEFVDDYALSKVDVDKAFMKRVEGGLAIHIDEPAPTKSVKSRRFTILNKVQHIVHCLRSKITPEDLDFVMAQLDKAHQHIK